jgi:acetyltransferase-like isoleucine patch superfamily enzyme
MGTRAGGKPVNMNRLFKALLARIAQFMPGGYSLRPLFQRLRGANIGKDCWISQNVYIDELYPEAVTIGDNCTIGLRTSIFAHFHWGERRATGGAKPVVIGNNVFIGPHCVILPGVRIGEGSVIRAGTVVTRNIPPRMFWGSPTGGPIARITVPLGPDSPYEDFVRGLKPLSNTSSSPASDTDLKE